MQARSAKPSTATGRATSARPAKALGECGRFTLRGRHEGSRRTTKIHEARCKGNRRLRRTQRSTERTEGHRRGRRASARRTASVSLEITKDTVQARSDKPSTAKDTKSTTQGAGRACAQGARPARGPVGAWRASHAMLWFGGVLRRSRRPICPIRPICPTALSFWHVADVPGVQGELLPAGAWGSAPHLPIS